MKRKGTLPAIAVLLLVLFAVSLYGYENWRHARAQAGIDNHALVVADALWNYNSKGVLRYLALACNTHNYREIVVYDDKGEVFQEVTGRQRTGLEMVLVDVGLMPVVNLVAEVSYQGNKIGHVEAAWFCDTIYSEAYLLLALVMLYVIIALYARILMARDDLAVQVRMRTEELTQTNERLRAEVELRQQTIVEKEESKKRFAELADLLPQPVWEADSAGQLTYVNQAALAVFDYSQEEFSRRRLSIMEMIAPECHKQARQNIAKLLRGEKPENHEYLCLTKNGSSFPGLIFSAVISQQGQPTGLRGVVLDISERVQAETLLRERESKLEGILRSSPTGIGIAVNRVFQEVNQRFCEMVGYRKDELLGQNARMIYPSDEEFERLGRMQLEQIRTQGMGALESRLRHKTGRLIDIIVSWRPIDENDWAGGVIFNVLDVTEMKKLEAHLVQVGKMESIGKLAGGIAHDFNNILTAINGYAEMIIRRCGDDLKLRRHAEQIKNAGERAAKLTGQLLGFSRRQMIAPRAISINHHLADMEQMLVRIIREDITLETIFAEKAGLILADPSQLEQIVINLLVNARDALLEVERTKKLITLCTTQVTLGEDCDFLPDDGPPGQYLLLQVEDNGCGMSAEVKERIFEPFYTTKDVGKGTGMGLATIYGILQQNRGTFEVESEPGQGTVFRIYWPLAPDQETQDEAEVDVEISTAGSETILLVEDDDQIREIAGRQLRELGYTIHEAENGLKALEITDSIRGGIDLLFTDVVMPSMGGRELHEKIKVIYPHIKVLYSSGYTEEFVAPEKEIGVSFIRKPYDLQNLAIRIRRLLDSYALSS